MTAEPSERDTATVPPYQTLFDNVAFGLICQDEGGRITCANKAAGRILGLPAESLVGRNPAEPGWDAISESGNSVSAENLPAGLALRGGQRVDNVVLGLRHATTGERRWLRMSSTPIESGTQTCTTIEDVTDQVRRGKRETLETYASVLKAVIASAPGIVVLLDRRLRVVEASHVVLEIWRKSQAEVAGRTLQELPRVLPPAWQQYYEKALAGETLQGKRFVWVAEDEVERFFDWRVHPWGDEGETTGGIGIHATDVTREVRAGREIDRINRLYAALIQVGRLASEAQTPQQLFDGAVDTLVGNGLFDMAWIGLTEEETLDIRSVASCGDETGYLKKLHISAKECPAGSGPTGTSVREGRPFVVNDYDNAPRTWSFRSVARQEGWRGASALPIRRGGHVIGALTTYSRELGFFGPAEMELLEDVAVGISSGLDWLDEQHQRQAAEQALLQSDERFRQVAEDSGVFVWEVNERGLFTYVSPSVRKMLGYRPEDLVGKLHPYDLVPDEMRALLAGKLGGLMQSGQPLPRTIMPSPSVDGETRTLETTGAAFSDAEGRFCGYRGSCRDVTEHHLSANRLKESEEQFRQLVEGANSGILIRSRETFRYLNPKARELLGVTDQPPGGISIHDIVRAGEATDADESLHRLVHGDQLEPTEFRGVRLDGEEFAAEITSVPFTIEGESGSVVFLRNIATRKEAERARLRLEQQFIQSQKMESVGRLAGGIAHDFNNLLQVINGYSSLAMGSVEVGSRLREDLAQISEAGERAAQLTQQLLAFSRKQVLQTRIVDLNDVVRNMEKILRRLIGEDIALQSSLAPAVPSVEADPGQLGQVLMNLAVNARDAMPTGGVLRLETSSRAVEPGLEALTLGIPAGYYAVVTVADTGVGMDAETQKAIFEPFFTTKEAGKGTGLGLSTVYGIVRQSKGGIGLESSPGNGSTFRIYLPAVNQDAPTRAPETGPTLNAGGVETILVVEDEASVRGLWVLILSSHGYTVISAESGPEAIRVASNHPGKIDLLLSDILLPGFTGPQIRDQLRASRPDLQVVFITGYTHQASVVGEPNGEGSYLAKPCSPDQLLARVREVLSA